MNHSVAILVDKESLGPRLNYVLSWLFDKQFALRWNLYTQQAAWEQQDAYLINYSKSKQSAAHLNLLPQGLLAQTGQYEAPQLAIQKWHHNLVLFYNQPRGKVPFDIFSAIFYLISRYEEYLPYQVDQHGRFEAATSVAHQFNFLQDPLVDYWLEDFAILLREEGLNLKEATFSRQLTFDVDMAWKFLYRDSKRQIGGFLRDLIKLDISSLKERKAVKSGRLKDPYDSFKTLETILQSEAQEAIFFLLGGSKGPYDRNVPFEHPAMQQLIQSLSKNHKIGLHPSYQSNQDPLRLKKEKTALETILSTKVTLSRQHYIKLHLPKTYRNLIDLGIEEDYSMGYASQNGFRAGTSRAFYWYDLLAEESTKLMVHPFSFMDACSLFYLQQSPKELFKEWQSLQRKVQKGKGHFISIWHNYLLYNGSTHLDLLCQYLNPFCKPN